MSYPRLASALAILALVPASLFTGRARAELPPQYTTWADFGAVAAQSEIPHMLGVVDRIERTQYGKFRVYGGSCFVEVTVSRETPRGPNGEIIVGGSRISRVEIGKKSCKP